MEDIILIVLIFGGSTAVAIAFSPIGRAIADRIRGRAVGAGSDPEVLAELDEVRGQLSELQERMEFSERLVARDRGGKVLGSGEGS